MKGRNIAVSGLAQPDLFRIIASTLLFSASLIGLPYSTQAATYTGSTSANSGTTYQPGIPQYDSFTGTITDSASSLSSINQVGFTVPSGHWSVEGTGISNSSVNTAGLHLSASSSAYVINTANNAASASSNGSGRFTDSFIINPFNCAPALCGAGAQGTMTVALDLDGWLYGDGSFTSNYGSLTDARWNGTATWNASMTLQGIGGTYGRNTANWTGGQSYSASQNGQSLTGIDFGRQLLTLNVSFGNQVLIDISGNVSSTAHATADGSIISNVSAGFIADLENTIGWGGILELRDANGNIITDFTAMSADTGFDYGEAYTSVIPLPAAFWLLLSGLSIFGLLGRRPK